MKNGENRLTIDIRKTPVSQPDTMTKKIIIYIYKHVLPLHTKYSEFILIKKIN